MVPPLGFENQYCGFGTTCGRENSKGRGYWIREDGNCGGRFMITMEVERNSVSCVLK